jgi:hypothetical protein
MKNIRKFFEDMTVLPGIIYLSLCLFCLSSAVAHAADLRVEISPSKVEQGNAFTLRVSGLEKKTELSAFLNEMPLRFSDCGTGCSISIGTVDLSVEPGDYAIHLLAGAETRTEQITVLPGKFEVIHITVPKKKATPGPREMKRIRKEADLLDSIWGIYSERLWEGQFILPLPNPLSTPFGTQRIFNKTTVSIHRGLDIKGREGEKIHASNHGRVVLTEELFFGGKTVVLDHGIGIFTIYMHLSRFNVRPGDLVLKKDVIGFVGSTGRSTGPHLHFGVKVAGINTSPTSIAALELD